MTVGANVLQASLTDPPQTSAIGSAMSWVSDVIFGPLATFFAIVAVAWLGFAMLTGRADIRRALAILLGCSLFFGARDIADGLRATDSSEYPATAAIAPLQPDFSQNPLPAYSPNTFDPYAGASFTNEQRQ